MKTRLLIVLTLIVALPTALMLGLGLRLARHEQRETRERFSGLLHERLAGVDADIDRLMKVRELELLRLLGGAEVDQRGLRKLVHSSPLVLQTFALDAEGKLIYPAPLGKLNENEWAFLERAQDLLLSKELLRERSLDGSRSLGAESPSGAVQGWHPWFWGQDIRLLYWTRDDEDRILGAELDLTSLLADIIAELPDTPSEPYGHDAGAIEGRIRLLDSRGETLYQWGSHEPVADASPAALRTLDGPLGAWSLSYHLPPEAMANRGQAVLVAILAGTIALALALGGLAVYFHRASSRELREAAQRVTFVNQVSHELKTPLTNIRLYGELLAERLDETDEKAADQAGVIVAESQRLSRLIGNILSFGRQQRKMLRLHRNPGFVDAVVGTVLDHYGPALDETGIKVVRRLEAGREVDFDPDALEQILGNLLSNVEKYAAAGGIVVVESRQTAGLTTITVSDEGPGIPTKEAEAIFRPFHRISNSLTDGITGTGIGLSIARELARLHGGDLVLLPTKAGASFRLTFAAHDAETRRQP